VEKEIVGRSREQLVVPSLCSTLAKPKVLQSFETVSAAASGRRSAMTLPRADKSRPGRETVPALYFSSAGICHGMRQVLDQFDDSQSKLLCPKFQIVVAHKFINYSALHIPNSALNKPELV
jgi:hypothetical protein